MHRIQCIDYKALTVHAILTQLFSLSNTTKLILAWFTCTICALFVIWFSFSVHYCQLYISICFLDVRLPFPFLHLLFTVSLPFVCQSFLVCSLFVRHLFAFINCSFAVHSLFFHHSFAIRSSLISHLFAIFSSSLGC